VELVMSRCGASGHPGRRWEGTTLPAGATQNLRPGTRRRRFRPSVRGVRGRGRPRTDPAV